MQSDRFKCEKTRQTDSIFKDMNHIEANVDGLKRTLFLDESLSTIHKDFGQLLSNERVRRSMCGGPEIGKRQDTAYCKPIEAVQVCKVSTKLELTVLLATRRRLNFILNLFYKRHPGPGVNYDDELEAWSSPFGITELGSLDSPVRHLRIGVHQWTLTTERPSFLAVHRALDWRQRNNWKRLERQS